MTFIERASCNDLESRTQTLGHLLFQNSQQLERGCTGSQFAVSKPHLLLPASAHVNYRQI